MGKEDQLMRLQVIDKDPIDVSQSEMIPGAMRDVITWIQAHRPLDVLKIHKASDKHWRVLARDHRNEGALVTGYWYDYSPKEMYWLCDDRLKASRPD